MERKEAIERLKQLRLDYTEFWEEFKNETTEALDMAIASLKTDEAYQIMYEGGEIFTKADMVAMLTELDNEIMGQYIEHTEADWHDIIQQKINFLKE